MYFKFSLDLRLKINVKILLSRNNLRRKFFIREVANFDIFCNGIYDYYTKSRFKYLKVISN